MDIYKLSIEDILHSEVTSQHSTFDFNVNDGQRVISCYIDLDKWNKSLSNVAEIEDCFESKDSLILQVAAERFENIMLSPEYNSATLMIKDEDSSYKREDLIDFFKELNEEIIQVIKERLGDNMEIFLKEKQEEAEYELSIDNENAIRQIFTKLIKKEMTSNEANIILSSSTMGSYINEGSVHVVSDNRAQITKNSQDRLSVISEIESSKFVSEVEQTQKKHQIKIILNNLGLSVVNDYVKQANRIFYNTPHYGESVDCTFIAKSSNGKGVPVDAWLTEEGKVKLVENGVERYSDYNKLDLSTPIGEKIKLIIGDKMDNNIKSRRSFKNK